MFAGFLLNLSLFLSSALGQLGVGPLRHASGMTLSPAGSGAVCQWQTSSTDRRGSGDQALNGAHWAPAPPQAFCKRAVTSQWDVAQQPTESADEKTENFMLLPL